jgi:hypothetical protein
MLPGSIRNEMACVVRAIQQVSAIQQRHLRKGLNFVNLSMSVLQKAKDHSQMPKPAPFKPCGGVKNRLSMWSVNPYQCDARPAPDMGCMLLK